MKDINLKPGTFSETLENASGRGPGKSLVKFILGVLSSSSACCAKVFAYGTVNNSTITLLSYSTTELAALTTGVAEGTLAYDTTLNKVHVFTGSTWVALH
jgi:hypothetical protein